MIAPGSKIAGLTGCGMLLVLDHDAYYPTCTRSSTDGVSGQIPCSVDKDSLPIHHQSSDDVGVGDCNSPNGAKLDPQSPPGQPVPPIPDPTNPELLVLAPSISPVEFGAELMLAGNFCQFVDAAVFHLFCCNEGPSDVVVLGPIAGLAVDGGESSVPSPGFSIVSKVDPSESGRGFVTAKCWSRAAVRGGSSATAVWLVDFFCSPDALIEWILVQSGASLE
ncbi:hypothetical protein Nepgr_002820 [Nepenthes gracilis]|uniref:Uncharacterized protein n=1 Tax=Nepenthes gracilis TaxID=150966 RepID=A0AAD3RYH6_NEPGR|nr:hypothetical protein Nepgr_002820 [Nepenthes gracilis]